jgi:hypothetical protein
MEENTWKRMASLELYYNFFFPLKMGEIGAGLNIVRKETTRGKKKNNTLGDGQG